MNSIDIVDEIDSNNEPTNLEKLIKESEDFCKETDIENIVQYVARHGEFFGHGWESEIKSCELSVKHTLEGESLVFSRNECVYHTQKNGRILKSFSDGDWVEKIVWIRGLIFVEQERKQFASCFYNEVVQMLNQFSNLEE